LDHAAATPVSDGVLAAMRPYFADKFYNPSATYLAATATKKDLERARADVAVVLGARPAEVIFTAGGTEANNLAIKGIALAFPGSHIVTTALEHDSVREPLKALKQQNTSHTEVLPEPDGRVGLGKVAHAITDNTVLVSVMYANNEIGTVQPIREIAQAIKQETENRKQNGNNLPLYLHTDACQAPNYLDIHVSRLGVDLMTLNGGKIYGAKQSGVLYAASPVRLMPLIHGGGQERGMRSGTENVAAAVGFAAALQQAQDKRKDESNRLQQLQTLFFNELETALPNIVINGSRKHRLPNNVHVTIAGSDNERLIFGLDEAGIMAAAGSACSASREEPSHVLSALGLSDEQARSSLRFTMGRATTEDDIKKTVRMLAKLVA
jgi:cysteine desulfurase